MKIEQRERVSLCSYARFVQRAAADVEEESS